MEFLLGSLILIITICSFLICEAIAKASFVTKDAIDELKDNQQKGE